MIEQDFIESDSTATASRLSPHCIISLVWISRIWLTFATVGLIWQLIEWYMAYAENLLNYTRPLFVLGVLFIVAYVMGWLSIVASTLQRRIVLLRMSSGLASIALLVAGFYSLWEYQHLALIRLHLPSVGDSPSLLSIRGIYFCCHYLQRAILPIAIYWILTGWRRIG